MSHSVENEAGWPRYLMWPTWPIGPGCQRGPSGGLAEAGRSSAQPGAQTDRQTGRKSEERAAKAAHDLALEAASAEPAVLLEGRAPLSST